MNDQPGTSKQMKSNEFNNNQPCTSGQASNNKSINECEVNKPTECVKETFEFELNPLLDLFVNCFVKKFEEMLDFFSQSNQLEEFNVGEVGNIIPISDENQLTIKSAKVNHIIKSLKQLTLDELRTLLVNVSGDIFTTFQNEIYVDSKDKSENIKQFATESVNRFISYVHKRNEIESYDNNLDKLRCLLTKGIIAGGSDRETTKIKAENIRITNGVVSNSINIFEGANIIEQNNKISKGYNFDKSKYGFVFCANQTLSNAESKVVNVQQEEPKNILSNVKLNHQLKKLLFNINKNDPIKLINDKFNDLKSEHVNFIKEEIKKTSSQQKNQENKRSIWFNIKPQVKNFTGRIDQLTQIHALLQNKSIQNQVVIQATAISGIGGIGKSELSRMYIHQYKDNYQNAIWIDSETKESIETSFQKLAQELAIENTTNTDIKIIVKKIYQYIGKSPSLIIFDNAEIYDDIKDFLPPSLPNDKEYQKPAILLTSRNNKWNVDEDDGEIQVMVLEFFSSKESISFIESTINEAHSNEDMMKLAEELDNYPLAIKQAVGYINVTNQKQIKRKQQPFRICDYLKEFLKNKIELLEFKSANNRYEQTIMTIWNVTFQKISKTENIDEKIQEITKNALEIIQIMSYLKPDINDFIELFKHLISDENKLWDSIDLLQQYSLISVDTERDTATIHRLLQVAVKNRLKENGEEIQILENVLLLLVSYDKLFYSNKENENKIHSQNGNIILALIYGTKYDIIIEKFYKNVYLCFRETPIFFLASRNDIGAVKNIVEYIQVNKPDELNDVINAVNKDNESILHAAVAYNNLDIVKYLIENGANINAINKDNRSILHFAVENSDLDTVKYIIEKGANINAVDENNQSILNFAVEHCDLDTVKYLIEKGANINAVNKDNRSALHFALLLKKLDTVKYLIEKGANINAVNNDNKSILYVALIYSDLDTVKYLIENGANINSVDFKDKIVLHYVKKNKTLEYLISIDANINTDEGEDEGKYDEDFNRIAELQHILRKLYSIRRQLNK